jgi:hypothetical protein
LVRPVHAQARIDRAHVIACIASERPSWSKMPARFAR